MSLVFSPKRMGGRVALGCFSFVISIHSHSLMAAETAVQPVATTSFASLLQVLFGLGLVLAAIAGTAWLLRRFAPGQVAASGALRVVGGVAVGPKERVMLVDVGDTRLVLGVAPGHISTLHQMPRPADEPAASETGQAAENFYARFRDILNKKGGA